MGEFADFDPAPYREAPVTADPRFEIRIAQPSDAEAITRLAMSVTQQREEEQLAATLRWISPPDERQLLLVAYVGERFAGFSKVAWFEPPVNAPLECAQAGFYMLGLVVVPGFRRRGIGWHLTRLRLRWISERSSEAFYFANAKNRASIALHQSFGFSELTRRFWFPRVHFESSEGILFGTRLKQNLPDAAP